MSYEKQTWANGDVITAEKLNHVEDGVQNNDPFIINVSGSLINQPGGSWSYSCDKKAKEIVAALKGNRRIIAKFNSAKEVPIHLASAATRGGSTIYYNTDGYSFMTTGDLDLAVHKIIIDSLTETSESYPNALISCLKFDNTATNN